jgi:hypothetical protein
MNSSEGNQSFRGGEPTWANACVGENGSPGILDYAAGFASAANALLGAVIAGQGSGLPVDTLIYPVCFNMRHAVELFLKAASTDLMTLADIRQSQPAKFNFAGSHNLSRIWEFVKHQALATDVRFEPIISELDGYVTDIANVDATGQVFRYPFDTESRKHLTEVAIINVYILRQRFNAAERLLHTLRRTNESLLEEYAWGTFTRNLSRRRLFQLATELPPRAAWGEASFDDTKSVLKAKYGLSGREFSKALRMIQQRHEMGALIGVQVDVPGLSRDALRHFFDEWVRVNDLENVKRPPLPEIVSAVDLDLEEVLRSEETQRKSVEVLDEPALSEAFEQLLAIGLNEAERHKNHLGRFSRSLGSLLAKPLAMEHVLNSLNFLGQQSYLEFMIERYGLSDSLDRLLERSERDKERLHQP